MAINNMNLEKMMAFIEKVKQDLSKSQKSKKVECSWNVNEGKPQMESKVQHPKGETFLQSDFVPFTGGSDLAPRADSILPLWFRRLLCRDIHVNGNDDGD